MQEHSHHKPPLTTSGTSNASNALLVIRSLCRAAPHSHFVSLFLLHGLGKQFARCKVTSSSSGVGVSGLLCCCWCWSRPRHRHRLSAIFPDFDKLSFTTQLCFCKSLVCCSLWSVCLTKLRLPQKSVSRIWYHTHIDAVLNRRGFTKILPKSAGAIKWFADIDPYMVSWACSYTERILMKVCSEAVSICFHMCQVDHRPSFCWKAEDVLGTFQIFVECVAHGAELRHLMWMDLQALTCYR